MPRRPANLARRLALAYSLALLGDQMLYVFLPSHPGDAGITAASLGIILSANRFVRLAANSIGGLASDRIGRRPPYLIGMALALVSTAGYLVSSSFWPLLFCRLVWGIAFALISVGGVAIMLDLATDAERGRTVGTYQSLLQLGTLLGLVASGFLTDLIGYRGALAVYAPLAAVGLAVSMIALGRDGGDGDLAARRRPASSGPRPPWLAGGARALAQLDRRLVVPACVSFAIFFTGSGVLMATLGVYLKELAAEADQAAMIVPVASLTGLLLASRRLAAMIEAPIVGRLLDRLDDRRAMTGAGILVSLAGFAVLASGRSATAVVAGVLLVAAGEGVLTPTLTVWAGEGAPPHLRGSVMGSLATAADLGAAIGPLVAYAMVETVGLRAAYGLSGALLLATLPLLAVARADAPFRSR